MKTEWFPLVFSLVAAPALITLALFKILDSISSEEEPVEIERGEGC